LKSGIGQGSLRISLLYNRFRKLGLFTMKVSDFPEESTTQRIVFIGEAHPINKMVKFE
jgi:hypothetical protein